MPSRREFMRICYDALSGSKYSGRNIFRKMAEPEKTEQLGRALLRYIALRESLAPEEDEAIGYEDGAARTERCCRLVSSTLNYPLSMPTLVDGRTVYGAIGPARGGFMAGGHFLRPDKVVIGGDGWTNFRFDNIFCHEIGHYAVFRRHGCESEPWVNEGVARCIQEDSMSLLEQETGQAGFLRSAYGFVIDDLSIMYHCLSRMQQTRIPEALVEWAEPQRDFAYFYSFDPLNPQPHLLGTSFMKLLQESYGHNTYKKLFNGDFSDVDEFLKM